MKPKVLFIYRVDRNNPSNSGVIQKLKGQVNATRKLGYQVDYITQNRNQTFCNQQVIYSGSSSVPHKMRQVNWFYAIKNWIVDHGYDIILIRYGLSTPSFLDFLRSIKHKRPSTKILIDLPTYPYDKEWSGLSGLVAIWMDHYLRKRLKNHVDYIIHLGVEPNIWDIPTILTSNGIDISLASETPLKGPIDQHETLHVIAVGKWQFWHGLDRVIRGISPKDHIQLHIVGTGPENDTFLQLVEHHGVEHQVRFYGPLTGSELKGVYDKCHMAIGTLGLHRKNVLIDSSLKHREYCIRGLPFILSSEDRDFPAELPFVKCFSGEAIITAQQLRTFYQSCQTGNDISQKMKDYAINNLSWTDKMKTVFDTIVKNGS